MTMMSPEAIKERVQSIIQLPAVPAVAMEVVAMADNPKTSASALSRVISADQARSRSTNRLPAR